MLERLEVAAPVAVLFVLLRDDRVQSRGHVGIGVVLDRFFAVILPEQVEVEQPGFHDDPAVRRAVPTLFAEGMEGGPGGARSSSGMPI
jgi:hypothetical protein